MAHYDALDIVVGAIPVFFRVRVHVVVPGAGIRPCLGIAVLQNHGDAISFPGGVGCGVSLLGPGVCIGVHTQLRRRFAGVDSVWQFMA